jgi:hypothetical protein
MIHGTGHRGRTAVAVAALVLGGVAAAPAALTTEACLAKKLKEWGKLRNCQAVENGKKLQAKPFDLAKCQTKFTDKLGMINALATAAAIACRYGVNTGAEAGTVTDYDTGLQWEQKTDDGSVHDFRNWYTWTTATNGTTPNGTAFTAFLGTLNNGTSGDGSTTSGCFAGHCDWRLPAIGELAGIVDLAVPGCRAFPFTIPCIDQTVFGPSSNFYWSASTDARSPGPDAGEAAWGLYFTYGVVSDYSSFKNLDYWVRGVRSGL